MTTPKPLTQDQAMMLVGSYDINWDELDEIEEHNPELADAQRALLEIAMLGDD